MELLLKPRVKKGGPDGDPNRQPSGKLRRPPMTGNQRREQQERHWQKIQKGANNVLTPHTPALITEDKEEKSWWQDR
jgi:hypothetical protein